MTGGLTIGSAAAHSRSGKPRNMGTRRPRRDEGYTVTIARTATVIRVGFGSQVCYLPALMKSPVVALITPMPFLSFSLLP